MEQVYLISLKMFSTTKSVSFDFVMLRFGTWLQFLWYSLFSVPLELNFNE